MPLLRARAYVAVSVARERARLAVVKERSTIESVLSFVT